jgi:hypothetical protein
VDIYLVLNIDISHHITMECTLVVSGIVHRMLCMRSWVRFSTLCPIVFCFSVYIPNVPCTYQVQKRYIFVHACKSFGIPSTNKYVLSWHSSASVHTMLQFHHDTTFYCSVEVPTTVYHCSGSWTFLDFDLVLSTSRSAK